MCAEKKCYYCGRTDSDRRVPWRSFYCPCGRSHDLCGFCYRQLSKRKVIVKRGQRGGGKKEFLKVCPNGELQVADALMGRPRFMVAWEAHRP